MLAFTGWIVNGFGLHFPGMLSKADGVSFDTLAKMSPMDAWEAVPEFGRHQMGAVIFRHLSGGTRPTTPSAATRTAH